MKSRFVFPLLILTFFCVSSAAQSRLSIGLDLRSDAGVATALNGSTGTRSAKSSGGSETSAAGSVEQRVFALINAERNKSGLPELEWSESLAAVARMHSEDMARVSFSVTGDPMDRWSTTVPTVWASDHGGRSERTLRTCVALKILQRLPSQNGSNRQLTERTC